MDILTFPLGQLQANCYFLIKDSSVLLIDPADSADFILEEIQRRNLNLVGMVATHGHFDHVMAVGEIQIAWGKHKALPLHIDFDDEFLLKRLGETAKHFLGYEPYVVPIKKITNLNEGNVSIGAFEFTVLKTPGHTPGSCCLYFPQHRDAINRVFTGDTLFLGAVGRYDFSYSDKGELKKSVERLLQLPEGTIVYPGHGAETLVQIERQNMTSELIGNY